MLQLVSKKKFYSGRKSKYGYYYIYSVVDGSNHYLKSFRSLGYAKKYLNRRIDDFVSKYPHLDFSNMKFMIAYRYPGFDNDSNEYEYYFKYVKESEV